MVTTITGSSISTANLNLGGTFVSDKFTSNNSLNTRLGGFVSNNYFAENQGPSLTKVSLVATNKNGGQYPQTESTALNRIADSDTPSQFSSYMFQNISGDNDFETYGLSFENNSFTLGTGVSVNMTIRWSADDDITWYVTKSGDWSGSSGFTIAGNGNTNPQFYTATGPGTFTFGPFSKSGSQGGGNRDLDIDAVIINSVSYTANVSLV